jgi:hypothetical protein
MKKLNLALLFFFILFSLCISVYAIEDDDVVDISKLPNKIAEALHAPLFAGQILASAIPFGLICFPPFLLTKNSMAHVSAIILSLSFSIAIGWLPVWIFLILCLLIGLMFAGQMRDFITGRGRG